MPSGNVGKKDRAATIQSRCWRRIETGAVLRLDAGNVQVHHAADRAGVAAALAHRELLGQRAEVVDRLHRAVADALHVVRVADAGLDRRVGRAPEQALLGGPPGGRGELGPWLRAGRHHVLVVRAEDRRDVLDVVPPLALVRGDLDRPGTPIRRWPSGSWNPSRRRRRPSETGCS